LSISRRVDPWRSLDVSAEVSPEHRRRRGEAGEPAAGARLALHPHAVADRMLPIPEGSAAVAGRGDRAPSLAIVAHLATVAVVAAATIGVFFGIAFALLQPPAKPTAAAQPIRERSGDVVAVPLRNPAERAAAVTADPAAVARIAGNAPALPAGSGAAKLAPIIAAGPAPRPAAMKPTGRPSPPMLPARLPDRQLAGLLARGDAFLRAGDIASARLFYERAADGGDGQAALRAGATFDPIFLARIGLRRMRGDRAKALFWYRRALGLGASNAAPYLHSLETK
jgi:hypothetical protein